MFVGLYCCCRLSSSYVPASACSKRPEGERLHRDALMPKSISTQRSNCQPLLAAGFFEEQIPDGFDNLPHCD
jgi:hypothetical protein